MLMTLKNKILLSMDNLIIETKEKGGVPAKILLEPQEAVEFLKELQQNKMMCKRHTVIKRADSNITDIKILLKPELTKPYLKSLLEQWHNNVFSIHYKDIEINVVKKKPVKIMVVEKKEPDVPTPAGRIVKEGEILSCIKCHSSLHSKWFFWTDGCLNYICVNYYGK